MSPPAPHPPPTCDKVEKERKEMCAFLPEVEGPRRLVNPQGAGEAELSAHTFQMRNLRLTQGEAELPAAPLPPEAAVTTTGSGHQSSRGDRGLGATCPQRPGARDGGHLPASPLRGIRTAHGLALYLFQRISGPFKNQEVLEIRQQHLISCYFPPS